MDKEDNANVQNVTDILPTLSFTLPSKTGTANQNQERNVCFLDKVNTLNVIFEPTEISAHSSVISNNIEGEQSLFNLPSNGINLTGMTDDVTKELNKESNDLKELDYSAFSGIFGEIDLSIASCPGKRVSVGQFFRRKCDMGLFWNDNRLKSNFATLASPVNRSVMVDAKTLPSTELPKERKENAPVLNATVDLGENHILSLSTIAGLLQDINSETPWRLVNHLLMAQERKKASIEEHKRRKTYTLPLERKSMQRTIPTTNSSKFDDDISLVNFMTKLALDSRTTNEAIDREKMMRTLSFSSNKNIKQLESIESICEMLKKSASAMFSSNKGAADKISAADLKLFLQHSTLSLSSNDKLNVFSCMPPPIDTTSCNKGSYSDINIQKIEEREAIKADVSDGALGSAFKGNVEIETALDSNSDVIIGKNTEQLCNCIVGMTCKANVELKNKGNKWITCTLKLSEVQGDQQSIALSIPKDTILIKPDGIQSVKIEIRVTKMCKPIIAVLNITLSDMMAKSKWLIMHMICFKPEELELDIMCNPRNKQELDFQYIAENTTKVLPIIFHNKNNIDVPVKLSISHEGPKIFSIDGAFSGPVKLNESRDELHLVLKPHEKFVADIKCKRSQSTSVDCSQKQPQYWRSKLMIHVQRGDGTALQLKEMPLCAQPGTCKVQIIDTDMPIIVSEQHSKLLHVINSGNVATRVSATVVPTEGYQRVAQEFSIKPDDISLQPEERGLFLITYKSQTPNARDTMEERHAKIKLAAGNNVYYYIVSTEQKPLEAENENDLRCDTPCNLVSTSYPTSPQSVTSSRSGPYRDRNSLISATSSSIVAGSAIPIKTTHATLVWNSVKLRKSEIKEFTIRNMSNNRIKIQIDICDDSKSFKFLGDRQTTNTSMILALQRTESKTLAVMFKPYRVGSVAGKIIIKHYAPTKESRESQYKRIPLYGYGGCSKLRISNTFKDANGKIWLSLGTLSSETTVLRANIKLQNTGDLCTFAKIKVIPKVISPTIGSNWRVRPTELLLNPKEIQQVSIKFYPRKEDLAILQQSVPNVSYLATITVVYGDEPTRWRIRRLYNKIKESGELAGGENETFKNVVHPICKTFPKEQFIPGLMSICDPIENLNDLCTGVQQHEIMLTVETCADDTLPTNCCKTMKNQKCTIL